MTDDRNKPDLSCVTMITLYNVKNVSEKSGFGKKETIGKEKRKADNERSTPEGLKLDQQEFQEEAEEMESASFFLYTSDKLLPGSGLENLSGFYGLRNKLCSLSKNLT